MWFTNATLARLIINGFTELKGLLVTAQSSIDAITAELTTLSTQLGNDVTVLTNEIAGLTARGVDTTALQAAASSLTDTVNTVSTLAQAAPSTTPDTSDTSTTPTA